MDYQAEKNDTDLADFFPPCFYSQMKINMDA